MAHVFISYSKRDYIDDNGQVLHGSPVDLILNTLSDKGISYWIDREELDVGVTYAELISKNIKDCDIFLFLASKNANTSSWTLREISSAIAFGKKILPVRLDHSEYADSVALYLAPIQYIDWQEQGEAEALRRIVSRINADDDEETFRLYGKNKLPLVTSLVLYAGIVFLSSAYAYLTYQFLWAGSLRSSEIMGGLVGYVCEFGVLLSLYYLLRMQRLRRCTFAFPALVIILMLLFGLLLRDHDILISTLLLLGGWGFIALASLFKGKSGKNFFGLMDKEQTLLRLSDSENVIIVYLVIKAVIIVVAHYVSTSS